ncbi:lanthionine synthetase LanC family protein [Tenacibaculum sp. TC6]|uniref:lanthionine synthetase LanC family protein n=1 Tax=Tenacibaculum sp. TC6 TaxID=3423223 RepID=UPI003D36ED61
MKKSDKRIREILSYINEKVLYSDVSNFEDDSVFSGKLSLALYSFLVYKIENEDDYLLKTQEVLENIFADISQNKSEIIKNITLADGLVGLGILLNILLKEGVLDKDYSEQLDVISDMAYENCLKMLKEERFDFFYGAIGLFHYLNEVNRVDYTNEIVDVLYKYGVKNDFLFYNNFDDPYVEGINFGVAHGSFAIISICLNLYHKGVKKDKVKEIVIKSIKSLCEFRKDLTGDVEMVRGKLSDFCSLFPYNIASENKTSFSKQNKSNKYYYTNRLGWCNGDLSRSLIIYKAAILFNNDEILDIAALLSLSTLNRIEEEKTAVRNFHMCHGSCGILMMYYSLFKLTNNNKYEKSIDFWKEKTLSFMEQRIDKGVFRDRDLEILTGWLGGAVSLYAISGENIEIINDLYLINI